MAENFFRLNATDMSSSSEGHVRGANNEVFDVIAGCLDYKRQKPVPIGDYYHTDDCTICLCHSTQKMCKQIYCAPPTNCDGFIKKDPLHCCDVCVPTNIIERPPDETSLNMKFGALTVTLFLIVSLILFTFHRLRRKRLLVTLRRLRGLRRQDTSFTCSLGGRDSIDATGQATVLNSINVAGDGRAIRVSGYQFTEAPPSYASAVTLPRPASTLPIVSDIASRGANVPFGEPPPPYPVAVDTVVRERSPVAARRNVLSSVVNALATIRRHRGVENAINTTVVSSQLPQHSQSSIVTANPSNSSHTRGNQTWRRSSRTSDCQDYFTDEASGIGTSSSLSVSRNSLNSSTSSDAASSSSCCCSQCDSGVSRDDDDGCSLSSNDVRPRSEMSMIRVVNNSRQSAVVNPLNNNVASIQTSEDSQVAAVSSVAEPSRQRLCDSCQMALASDTTTRPPNDSALASRTNANESKTSKRRNVCKRKLKKLISRRKKKKNGASAAVEVAANVAAQISKSRRRCRRPSDIINVQTNDNDQGQQSTSRSSGLPNELITSV